MNQVIVLNKICMKHITVLFLIAVFTILTITETDAQRKKRRIRDTDERKEEQVDLKDHLNYEIKLGYIGGASSVSYSTFGISAKSNIGYKLNNLFTPGLGAKGFYQYVNYAGSSQSDHIFSYSGFAMLRLKFLQQFYIQGEYHYARFPGFDLYPTETILYPAVGGGYMNVGQDWAFGTELIVLLNDAAIDRSGVYEIWINFSKNF